MLYIYTQLECWKNVSTGISIEENCVYVDEKRKENAENRISGENLRIASKFAKLRRPLLTIWLQRQAFLFFHSPSVFRNAVRRKTATTNSRCERHQESHTHNIFFFILALHQNGCFPLNDCGVRVCSVPPLSVCVCMCQCELSPPSTRDILFCHRPIFVPNTLATASCIRPNFPSEN